MERRLGTISLFLTSRASVKSVNTLLSDYSDMIQARLGLPDKENNMAVIMLIVNGTTDEIGALTGKLGNIENVKVKSALSK